MQQSVSNLRQKFEQQPWGLWWIQAQRLTCIELRRNLFTWRASWIYFLAFIPTVIVLIHLMVDTHPAFAMNDDTNVLAAIIQLYYIRLGVFFGCLGIFSRLIRGEMIERSLHFYLLSPVRREVLLIAKFVAGSITAVLLFGSAVIADFALMYAGFGTAGRDYIFNGAGLGQLEAYLAIIVLACLGYGAVFLMPVRVAAEGILALLTVETEPVSGWAATGGLLLLIAVVLCYSCYRIRKLEIRYTTE